MWRVSATVDYNRMVQLKLALDDHPPPPAQRHPLRTIARAVGVAGMAAVMLFVVAAIATARPGDRTLWPPAAGVPTTEAFVISHGYHSGLLLPRRSLQEAGERGLPALAQIATRFAGFEWLEIGWGDEGFYRLAPTIESVTVPLALRALLRPGNRSVLHVVGFNGAPRAVFVHSELIRLELGRDGFERLAARLDESFARNADGGVGEPLGPGLYGTSLFFPANGAFHLFNLCNHWTAGMLDAAGVPTTPVLATFAAGLFADLEWRSHLERLPPPANP
jgi:uncharacterized protein (TIGR02117 family)